MTFELPYWYGVMLVGSRTSRMILIKKIVWCGVGRIWNLEYASWWLWYFMQLMFLLKWYQIYVVVIDNDLRLLHVMNYDISNNTVLIR